MRSAIARLAIARPAVARAAVATAAVARAAVKVPPSLRPLRVMMGGHALTRQYAIYHYTNSEAGKSIETTGMLRPGSRSGHQGVGLYFTTMARGAFGDEEIKMAVRHPKISDEAISHTIKMDTDDLDRLKIRWISKGNIIFIPCVEPLNIKMISTHKKTTKEE
jgi:hypothetical protein